LEGTARTYVSIAVLCSNRSPYADAEADALADAAGGSSDATVEAEGAVEPDALADAVASPGGGFLPHANSATPAVRSSESRRQEQVRMARTV
jgi:hypothetical protein